MNIAVDDVEDADEDDDKDTEIKTTMTTTILMSKPERVTGEPKRVDQTCTEVVHPGFRATDLGFGKPLTHGGQNPGSKSTGAKSGGQNPDNGFGTWKSKPLAGAKSGQNGNFGTWKSKPTRGTKSGRQNSGQRILDSEIQTPTGDKIRVANSGRRIWNSEIQTRLFQDIEIPEII